MNVVFCILTSHSRPSSVNLTPAEPSIVENLDPNTSADRETLKNLIETALQKVGVGVRRNYVHTGCLVVP